MLVITAHVPGKCACCNTPYGEGARLGLEYGKWVLVTHPVVEQPRKQSKSRTDQWLMGRFDRVDDGDSV